MKKFDYKNRIDKLLKDKNFSELEDLCLKGVMIYEDAIFYYYLGVSQVNLNKINLSIYNLEKAIFLNPKISFFHSRLAYVYLKINNLSLAKELFKKSIELESNNEAIQIDYLKILKELKDKDFFKQLEKVLKIFPESKELKKLKD